MQTDWPSVSVIIPVRNEADHLRACLESVLAVAYPPDRLEVIVVDGMSDDGTPRVVQSFQERGFPVRVLPNPDRIQAAGMNVGIRHARGEIILRLDAHTRVPPDYVRTCVEVLQQSGAANVGGPLQARGRGWRGRVIAAATTSFFGAGDARFRWSRKPAWVDTVFPGCWWKRTLIELGGFNEAWVVNEDYELNVRIRKNGGRIYLDPRIRIEYWVRTRLRDLARQYFRYGMWKIRTLRAHPDSLRWRQLAPPVLVLGTVLSACLIPWSPTIAAIIPGLYAISNVAASVWTGLRRGPGLIPGLPLAYATVHFSWGLGFWAGLFRFGVPAFTLRTLIRAGSRS